MSVDKYSAGKGRLKRYVKAGIVENFLPTANDSDKVLYQNVLDDIDQCNSEVLFKFLRELRIWTKGNGFKLHRATKREKELRVMREAAKLAKKGRVERRIVAQTFTVRDAVKVLMDTVDSFSSLSENEVLEINEKLNEIASAYKVEVDRIKKAKIDIYKNQVSEVNALIEKLQSEIGK